MSIWTCPTCGNAAVSGEDHVCRTIGVNAAAPAQPVPQQPDHLFGSCADGRDSEMCALCDEIAVKPAAPSPVLTPSADDDEVAMMRLGEPVSEERKQYMANLVEQSKRAERPVLPVPPLDKGLFAALEKIWNLGREGFKSPDAYVRSVAGIAGAAMEAYNTARASSPAVAPTDQEKWCQCLCHEDGEPWCAECFDANHVNRMEKA